MSIEDAFFLLKPADLDGENIENHHVFDGAYDTNNDEWSITSQKSRCGKVKKLKGNSQSTKRDTNEKEFCHKLVEGHNKLFNVCGACMATFFSDDDDNS